MKRKIFFLRFFLHFHKQRILFYLFHSTWFTFFLCCCQMSINYRFLLHSIPRVDFDSRYVNDVIYWLLKVSDTFFRDVDTLDSLFWREFVSRFGLLVLFAREFDSMGIIYLYGVAQLFIYLLLLFLLIHSFHDPGARALFSFLIFHKNKK